jgi:uncharacterized protein
MFPWRYSNGGISVALRVTPRGGRDEIDAVEQLADGRAVIKIRVLGEALRVLTLAKPDLKD